MKHTFTLLLLTLTLICQAQFKAINMDASSCDSAILFRDIKNHITFKGLKDLSKHGVSIEGAALTSPQYANIVNVIGIKSDTVIIHLFKAGLDKPKVIYSRKFFVQNAGQPNVVLKQDSSEQPSGGRPFYFDHLEIEYPNPNYTGECKVAHFEISIKDSKDKLILSPTFISGNYLNPPISDKIASLAIGSKIYFKQVIIKYLGEDYVKYDDFVLEKN